MCANNFQSVVSYRQHRGQARRSISINPISRAQYCIRTFSKWSQAAQHHTPPNWWRCVHFYLSILSSALSIAVPHISRERFSTNFDDSTSKCVAVVVKNSALCHRRSILCGNLAIANAIKLWVSFLYAYLKLDSQKQFSNKYVVWSCFYSIALTTKYVKVQSRPQPLLSFVGYSSKPGRHGNLATHFSCSKHENHARCTITMNRSIRFDSLICLRATPLSWQTDSISVRRDA